MIRNLAVPRHFVSYLVFFSSIRVDPGPYIVTIPENTYPRGKHGEMSIGRMPVVLVASIIDSSFYLMLDILPILLIKCSHLLPNVKTFC